MNRVVITGIGAVTSNAIGCEEFSKALKKGESGIEFNETMRDANFNCHVSGTPKLDEDVIQNFTDRFRIVNLKSSGILYGLIAATEAWEDAGLEITSKADAPDWDTGCLFGTNINGIEPILFCEVLLDQRLIKKMGGRMTQQAMNSGISAYLSGLFGLGNQVTSNSSACNAGSEAIIESFYKIKFGFAKRMLCGASETGSKFVWAPFDSMRALSTSYNDNPKSASRPLSEGADGFVPSCGSGALILESLDSAIERKAKIYAEVLGGHVNSGGQRNGGSMAMANKDGVIKCIQTALTNCNISSNEIDLISGHLTSTIGDQIEVDSWRQALDLGNSFPLINSTKSMIGHALGASGAIETVAGVIQMKEEFVHASINATPVHPKIGELIPGDSIPQKMIPNKKLNIIAKSSFGFGDINSCLILKRFES